MSTAIQVEAVVKRFGSHLAVDSVSFSVPAGVVYGVLGPNGAGKSTTLRMINDVIAPDSGTIRILDTLVPGLAAARRIGYLPEERGLYPKMIVTEMVQFMGELRGLARAEAARRSRHWLERLGLSKWATHRVQDLSKGMQQKVQFATALIHEPEILILDEPWSGLDPINADVLRTVVDEVRAAGRTVVFSTHLMEQAEKVCDQVCIIARGRKVLDGNLQDLKRAAAAKGRIALGFDSAQDLRRAQVGPLADRSLVVPQSSAGDGRDSSDCVVELAAGVSARQLLVALTHGELGIRRFEAVTPTLHQIFIESVGEAVASERSLTDDGAGDRAPDCAPVAS